MKKRIWLTGIIVILAVVGLLGFRRAERDGYFDLTRVRVDNSGPVDSALVAEILEPCFGQPLFSLDTDTIRNALLEIEGLRSVSVSMHFPNSMVISMTPAKAAACMLKDGVRSPVDLEGSALPPAWDSGMLPELTIEGDPVQAFIASGIDLLVKRDLTGAVTLTVNEQGLAVHERDNLILMSGVSARRDWFTWISLRDLIGDAGCTIDLRYAGQAVISGGEGAGV